MLNCLGYLWERALVKTCVDNYDKDNIDIFLDALGFR
jgi:hypothetical protein